ncbi:hypothetical protein PCANC_06785 [Puccinia coronata f. sp. avenae]|uniref:Uncharacterized protein n=1 Tax=Puccinia coronata f. sp. avenae TaxID=200324 RepID=A0A2N5UU34_9BASI|nr:hypothetical protein PCANC_06785 [Puccinia coronata f. sp. avenae]
MSVSSDAHNGNIGIGLELAKAQDSGFCAGVARQISALPESGDAAGSPSIPLPKSEVWTTVKPIQYVRGNQIQATQEVLITFSYLDVSGADSGDSSRSLCSGRNNGDGILF